MIDFFQRLPVVFMALIQSAFWFIPGVWDAKEAVAYAVPDYANVAQSQADAQAAGGGWYVVLDDDFSGSSLNSDVWVTSPHGKRNTEYWCTNLVSVQGGEAVVSAAYLEDNVCTVCPQVGDFTSGIETRGKLEQAFGYFEARVKFPNSAGMWSAMWLQANSVGRLGNGGKDGSEIDVFESAFYFNPQNIGACIHWDAYEDLWYRNVGTVSNTGINLYDDYHVWGLLWTPTSYTVFLDGKALWKTGAGGVSQVPEFLRLTCEVRRTGSAPYGQKLGAFTATKDSPAEFNIDYVRIYQHTDFLSSIKAPGDFKQPLLASIAQK
ncbi:MAG: glycoside hydrolase family 16 protein [Oscillospiraceae bacterium]|jgi:beta-glucanase (GH16 family)|nr:glycoside hydrolase family 16 protein [Oscillospiraceae bacterium]